jgi:hypothetical protein
MPVAAAAVAAIVAKPAHHVRIALARNAEQLCNHLNRQGEHELRRPCRVQRLADFAIEFAGAGLREVGDMAKIKSAQGARDGILQRRACRVVAQAHKPAENLRDRSVRERRRNALVAWARQAEFAVQYLAHGSGAGGDPPSIRVVAEKRLLAGQAAIIGVGVAVGWRGADVLRLCGERCGHGVHS